MSDIDFDELDRAVNSLISGAPNINATPVATVPANPISVTSTPVTAPVPTPVPFAPNSATATASTPAPALATAPQSLAGQRSSGRFMDVIHPSSDMRTASGTAEPAKPTVQAPTFRPISTTLSSQPVSASNPVTMPKIELIQTEKPQDDEGAISSQESPFISGAKVEKRPLGAFSATATEPTVELSPSGEVTEKPSEKPDQVDMTEAESPLPEELQGDLLKIESGNSTVNDLPVDDEKPASTEKPVGPDSIVQQYREEPAKKDEKPGAIYDTSVYHKPLKSEPKKKTGWLWILWIVLLIIVGVGAGAVAYFYVLPLIK